MTAVMFCNTNNIDDDILNKWCLYMIKTTLKLRLIDIIDCHNDDMIDKCMQVVNSTVKEHKDLLLLMHHKMTRNFLLNWVAWLSEHFIIIVILILNNVTLTDVVTDML